MSPQSRLCEPLRPQCQERRLMGTPPGEPLLQGDPDAAWRVPASPFPLCPCTCSARRDRPPPAEPRVRESPPQVGSASCGAPVLFLGASSREWWGRGRHASHPKQRLRVAIRWLTCLLPGPAALLSLGLNSALILYLPGTRATRASSNLGSPCAGSLSSVEQSKCK